jgi:hypothetical protein
MAEKTERQKYIAKLQGQLDKAIAGENFHQTKPGKLIVDILRTDVTNFTNDVLSDKFIKDHDGYLDARAKANYASSLLDRLVKVANPVVQQQIRGDIKAAVDEGKDEEDDI